MLSGCSRIRTVHFFEGCFAPTKDWREASPPSCFAKQPDLLVPKSKAATWLGWILPAFSQLFARSFRSRTMLNSLRKFQATLQWPTDDGFHISIEWCFWASFRGERKQWPLGWLRCLWLICQYVWGFPDYSTPISQFAEPWKSIFALWLTEGKVMVSTFGRVKSN